MMDEMYIHKQTEFSGDNIYGYVDIGAGEMENVLVSNTSIGFLWLLQSMSPGRFTLLTSLSTAWTGAERANLIREEPF